ncbi:hypothetical protein MCAG_03459 [Micromonospora sp. ATCC 39149]|uniref:Uncharacterized protein n=1 Tax=Micromonospora carbonacea TaxID=47853 RepID=A0A7D5YDX2_9ACTN|nr:hypothetical protein [Micromonospora sp. ATCC 39149]EEP73132.1 hypothetical protein MCAG_03459 [Micromonospora sp. ATCC 39149]QLJ99173.1 hypothetical protein HZU44_03075 [Micromonospora carbonacea]
MTDTDDRTGTVPGRFDGGRGAAAWAVLLPPGRYDAERLVHHDTLELTGLDTPAGATDPTGPRPGDPVVVLTEGPLRLVAVGRVARPTAERREDPDDPQSDPVSGAFVVAYTRRAFDEPVPAEGLALDGPVTALSADAYRALLGLLGPPPARRSWLVSLDLPIEAATPAEAVRLFWSYVRDLGPRELPTFVSPSHDELAMQAFVLGAESNQDPEED